MNAISDAVNMIHDVISTANPFHDTAKFMFFGVKNYKTQPVRCCKINRIRNNRRPRIKR